MYILHDVPSPTSVGQGEEGTDVWNQPEHRTQKNLGSFGDLCCSPIRTTISHGQQSDLLCCEYNWLLNPVLSKRFWFDWPFQQLDPSEPSVIASFGKGRLGNQAGFHDAWENEQLTCQALHCRCLPWPPSTASTRSWASLCCFSKSKQSCSSITLTLANPTSQSFTQWKVTCKVTTINITGWKCTGKIRQRLDLHRYPRCHLSGHQNSDSCLEEQAWGQNFQLLKSCWLHGCFYMSCNCIKNTFFTVVTQCFGRIKQLLCTWLATFGNTMLTMVPVWHNGGPRPSADPGVYMALQHSHTTLEPNTTLFLGDLKWPCWRRSHHISHVIVIVWVKKNSHSFCGVMSKFYQSRTPKLFKAPRLCCMQVSFTDHHHEHTTIQSSLMTLLWGLDTQLMRVHTQMIYLPSSSIMRTYSKSSHSSNALSTLRRRGSMELSRNTRTGWI